MKALHVLGEALDLPLPDLPTSMANADEADGGLKLQYHSAWADVPLWDTEEEQAFYEDLPDFLNMFPTLTKVR